MKSSLKTCSKWSLMICVAFILVGLFGIASVSPEGAIGGSMAFAAVFGTIEVLKNPNDVKLTNDLYLKAAEEGLNFSQLLERINPSESGDKLDAFERQLKRFGIVLHADPDKGIYPSKGELFFQSNLPESRVLFPEFINRTIRAALMQEEDLLSYLVADWDISDAGVFRAPYLDDSQAMRQSGRRAEGARSGAVKVDWSEKAVSPKDFGIEIDMSYEFVRRAPVSLIRTILSRMALQRRLDEAAEALDVLLSGDGTSKEGGAISSTNLSTYGVSSPSGTESLTYVAYLKWLAIFSPYKVSTIIGTANDIVEWFTMAKPSVDPILMSTVFDKGQTGGVPKLVNLGVGNVSAVVHEDAPANALVALDKRFALQGHRDVGLDLVETDRLISAKWEKIVITNKVGFSKIWTDAAKKLVTNA